MSKWKLFMQSDEGIEMKLFFEKLRRKIMNINSKEKGKAVLVINTRKGYWIYKLYEKYFWNDNDEVKVFSDRYIKKLTDFSEFEGKHIFVMDDTMTSGITLMETFRSLYENLDKNTVIQPIIFAIKENLEPDEKAQNTSDESESAFWNNLQYWNKSSSRDIGALCVSETMLLHDEGIPYVIDLPFLKDKEKEAEKTEFRVTLTKEQFEQFRKGTNEWNYYQNDFSIMDKLCFHGYICRLRDKKLDFVAERFALDYLIEGTYKETENGEIKIIFVPFVLASSYACRDIEALWEALLKVEGNRGQREDNVPDNLKQNYMIRKYRECVFALSFMVAERFIQYINNAFRIQLTFDMDIVKEHFSEEFLKKIQKMAVNNELYDNFLRFSMNYQKEDILWDTSVGIREVHKKKPYKKKLGYQWVEEQLLARKELFQNGSKSNDRDWQKKGVLLIEEVDAELENHFTFSSLEEKQIARSKIIVQMLTVSTCSNKLFLSSNGRCLHRGFRYGENSDLLLSSFDLYFYWAVVVLRELEKSERLSQSYIYMTLRLKRLYKELKIFDEKFTEDDFEKNANYYKNVINFPDRIENKQFFLHEFFQGRLSKQMVIIMGKVENVVREIIA